MSLPTDFNDPIYGHVKQDIIAMLTGPLAYPGTSEESALRKVRQHCGAEYGYSDELVRSLPQWQSRFASDPIDDPKVLPEEPHIQQPTENLDPKEEKKEDQPEEKPKK